MAFTTTGSVSYDTAAYDLLARFAYRPELYFDNWADVKSTNSTHRGASVTFWQQSDMAVAITPLTEDVDVTPVALSNTSTTVTMLEYGNATVTTARLSATSVLDIDPIAANVIGYNAGISMDTLAGNVWATGSNVRYAKGSGSAQTSRAALTATNTLTSADLRRAYAELSGANVPTFNGYYIAMIHPDVAYDLKSETGDLGWRAPQVYGTSQEKIRNGEIGAYEGFRFIVSPRAPLFTNVGSPGTVDVYRSLFMGQEAMAKAYSTGGGYGPDPVVVRGLVTDVLQRFSPIGWKHFVGYSTFRPEALQAVESASSIGTNAT
jgi:N4-gp56 family major capsid protein